MNLGLVTNECGKKGTSGGSATCYTGRFVQNALGGCPVNGLEEETGASYLS
jgi:hypothetical protein